MDVNLPQNTSGRRDWRVIAAVICAGVAVGLFHTYGNNSAGYIKSASLFSWWTQQWSNPASGTEHGWLVLAVSAWLLWRNVGKAKKREIGKAGNLGNAEKGEIEKAGSRGSDGRAVKGMAKGGTGEGAAALEVGAEEREGASSTQNPKPKTQDSEPISVLAAMLGGLALHGVGFAAQQARFSIIALLLFIWGVLRLGGGRRWGSAAAFPLGFMVFAIPVNALDSIGFWLRVWVVDASAWIADAVGIAVLQSGTQLVAVDGSYNYDVAAACSGVRSLTAMTALSLLAGYLNFQTTARRLLVLALCFPLVYLGNVARIVAIILAAEAGGPAWGDVAHEIMGFGVFIIVLGGVLGGIAAIRRWWPEEGLAVPSRPELQQSQAIPAVVSNRPGPLRRAGPTFIAGIVLALGAVEMAFLHYLSTRSGHGDAGVALAADGVNPVELPAFVGTEWIGRRTGVSAIEREILPPDTGFSRKTYVSVMNPAHSVFLSIVLSGRDRTSIHRPELCLVGQGWTVVQAVDHRFSFPAEPSRFIPATVLRVQRELQTTLGKTTVRQLTAYWFVSADTIVPTHLQMFALDAWNRVIHARADRWAYVLLQTDASDGEPAALARMQAVLDATLPVFQQVFSAEDGKI